MPEWSLRQEPERPPHHLHPRDVFNQAEMIVC